MNPHEMGADLSEICQKINKDKSYRNNFQEAFGIDSVAPAHISRALAQYMRTLISADAKYDSVQLGLAHFSKIEMQGKKVFTTNCASCHTPPLFTDNQFHHNGLAQIYSVDDLSLTTGRFRITRDSSDLRKYKTPSLRNLSITAPFMHDGRFGGLDEVLNHYQNLNSANQNQDLLVEKIKFSDTEKLALKAFLKTLEGRSMD